MQKIKNLKHENGFTEVKIILDKNDKIHTFSLKDKRKVNNELLNSLNLVENVLVE